MPEDIVCAKDTRDLLIDCCVGEFTWLTYPFRPFSKCTLRFGFDLPSPSLSFFIFVRAEFIHLIASEANEICEKEAKKTIAAEHVITALQTLGFESYLEEVEEVFKEHKKTQKVSQIMFIF